MAIKFCPLASGSSGNCIYFGTESTSILIDAGLSGKRIEGELNRIGVDPKQLSALFLTHEHSDHITGAGILSRRFDLPIFATEKTWRYFERHGQLGKVAPKNKRLVSSETSITHGDITISPFQIPHDAVEPVGYQIFAEGRKLTIATDLGHVSDAVRESVVDSDVLLIESNHDLEMLKNGPYPADLKRRVMGKMGHLSNATCGSLIAEVMSSRLKHVFLGHLSRENNRPLIALDTVTNVLLANKINVGVDLEVYLTNRDCAGFLLEL